MPRSREKSSAHIHAYQCSHKATSWILHCRLMSETEAFEMLPPCDGTHKQAIYTIPSSLQLEARVGDLPTPRAGWSTETTTVSPLEHRAARRPGGKFSTPAAQAPSLTGACTCASGG